jgi:hypothetical protein
MLRPMRFVAEPISDLRLQRFHRWAMLWLNWFAVFLSAAGAFAPLSRQAQGIGHGWLDRIERIVMAIVMLRAVRHVRRVNPRKGVAEHRRKDSALARAVVGSTLRRSLRSKDVCERIERLTQSIDALVARLLRRLPRGLTRRCPIIARREMRMLNLCDAYAPFPLLSDTS